MSHRITLPSLLTGLIAVATLAACGTSSTSPGSTSNGATVAPGSTAPTSAPATSASTISTGSCPSASTVGGALGVTLPAPTVVTPGAGATPLPVGAAGIACSYVVASPTVVVIVVLGSGLPSSFLSTEEQKEVASLQAANFSINFTPVSGVGDQAATYMYTANGLTVEGVLAGQGGNFAGVFTEGTSASLSQIESLVKQLL
jgi:hypothetical protein